MVWPAQLDYMKAVSRTPPVQPMSGLFLILVPLALAAVAIVLGLGLYNLARGGSPERSQELMRWRVILQLVALVIVMTALFFASSG
jgi:hypothetical protein